jgi:hypothetical protein
MHEMGVAFISKKVIVSYFTFLLKLPPLLLCFIDCKTMEGSEELGQWRSSDERLRILA